MNIRFGGRHPQREACIDYMRSHPKEPNKTLAKQFGVTPKTIRNWRRRHGVNSPTTIDRNGVERRNPSVKAPIQDIEFHAKKITEALETLRGRELRDGSAKILAKSFHEIAASFCAALDLNPKASQAIRNCVQPAKKRRPTRP